MTPAMTAIQLSILDIMKACVVELKRTNPAVSIALGGHLLHSLMHRAVSSEGWNFKVEEHHTTDCGIAVNELLSVCRS